MLAKWYLEVLPAQQDVLAGYRCKSRPLSHTEVLAPEHSSVHVILLLLVFPTFNHSLKKNVHTLEWCPVA